MGGQSMFFIQVGIGVKNVTLIIMQKKENVIKKSWLNIKVENVKYVVMINVFLLLNSITLMQLKKIFQ